MCVRVIAVRVSGSEHSTRCRPSSCGGAGDGGHPHFKANCQSKRWMPASFPLSERCNPASLPPNTNAYGLVCCFSIIGKMHGQLLNFQEGRARFHYVAAGLHLPHRSRRASDDLRLLKRMAVVRQKLVLERFAGTQARSSGAAWTNGRFRKSSAALANRCSGRKADFSASPILDSPSIGFCEAPKLCVRIYCDRLIGPFERRQVRGMIRIKAHMSMSAQETGPFEPVRDHP